MRFHRVGVVAATLAAATLLFVVSVLNVGNEATVLSESYNVPYFSTFLAPVQHFTRGGLHQAAAPYEEMQRKQGIVDNDGVHFLNPAQSVALANELDGTIHQVLKTEQPPSRRMLRGKPLNPVQALQVTVSVSDRWLRSNTRYIGIPLPGSSTMVLPRSVQLLIAACARGAAGGLAGERAALRLPPQLWPAQDRGAAPQNPCPRPS